MKIVFISQPMNGLTDSEVSEDHAKAVSEIKKLLGEPVAIIDKFVDEYPEKIQVNKGLYCLGKSLELLSMADIVYFAKGWEDARGCKIEHDCAMNYGITCYEYGYEDPINSLTEDNY